MTEILEGSAADVGPVSALKLEEAPTCIVPASHYTLQDMTSKGWHVVASYVGTGIIHSRRVPRSEEDRKARDEWDREVTIDTIGPCLYLVLQRSTESAMSELAKETELLKESERKSRQACTKAETDLATLKASSDAATRQGADLAELRERHATLERHMSAVRESIGSDRYRDIVALSDENVMPF